MSKDRKGSGFFSGLIIGSAIGAVVAFFLSQKSDKDSFGGRFGDLVAKGRDSIREAIHEGKETAARKETEYQSSQEEKNR